MSQIYVISKIGWEYDDSSYYRPEDEGGTPVKAYRNKAAAQAECDHLNAAKCTSGREYLRRAEEDEEPDEWGCVPITNFFEVIPITLEDLV